jgi:hypothetical protein
VSVWLGSRDFGDADDAGAFVVWLAELAGGRRVHGVMAAVDTSEGTTLWNVSAYADDRSVPAPRRHPSAAVSPEPHEDDYGWSRAFDDE